jgi:hypothetical protein
VNLNCWIFFFMEAGINLLEDIDLKLIEVVCVVILVKNVHLAEREQSGQFCVYRISFVCPRARPAAWRQTVDWHLFSLSLHAPLLFRPLPLFRRVYDIRIKAVFSFGLDLNINFIDRFFGGGGRRK